MAKNPDDERIRAEIQRAINITKDFEEPYRSKAFEIILSKSLGSPVSSSTLERKQGSEKEQGKQTGHSEPSSFEARIRDFAEKCNLDIPKLRNVFEFEADKPIFIITLNKAQSEKQTFVSRLLLAVYKEIYGQEWLSLAQVLESNGISSRNLSRTLDKQPDIFRKKGEKSKRQYKLVDSAKTETYKMIYQIANGIELSSESKDEKRGGARREFFSPKIDELIKQGFFKLPNKRKLPDVMKAIQEKGLPTSGKEKAILIALKRRLGKTLNGTKEGNEWVFWTE